MTERETPKESSLAFRWALPETLEIPPDELQCRLDVYTDSIVLHTVDDGHITSRPVSARDVTLALLSSVPLGSGLLPENALWWIQAKRGVQVALWRPPKVWRVAIMLEAFKPPRRFNLPMPGLIFVCTSGRPPRVFAAKKRPTRHDDPVYNAPLFNIFSSGETCPGTHKYPSALDEIPESFFASFFTREASHRERSKEYPNDLLKLWESLDGKRRYPLNDLVQVGILMDIMK